MREVYSAVSTDMEISLSVHLQFYLFSGDESSLFSWIYTDIDMPLSAYLQFYLFSGSESSLFSCPYNPIHNCGTSETAGVKCG